MSALIGPEFFFSVAGTWIGIESSYILHEFRVTTKVHRGRARALAPFLSQRVIHDISLHRIKVIWSRR